MNKRFNIRFALYLAGSLAVLGTATHFLHGYQVRRTSGAMLARADQVEQEGQIERAAEYLGRYVALNPTDTDALARFGTLLANDPSRRAKARALGVLNKVLFLDRTRNDVRRQVVRLEMALGEIDTAQAELKDLVTTFPRDGELYILRGRCYEVTTKCADARNDYEEAVRDAPQTLEGYERLAALLRGQTRNVLRSNKNETATTVLDRANEVINEMVRANDKSFRAYLLRAQYRLSYGVGDGAVKPIDAAARDVASAQKLAPDEADVCLASAELALGGRRQPDEARKLLRRGRDQHPKDWRLYLAAARLEFDSGKTDAALECLHEGLEQKPGQLELQWELADVLIAAAKTDDAKEAIARLEKGGFPGPFLDCLRGRLLMRAEQWGPAIEQLEIAYAGLAGLASQPGNEAAAAQCERAGLWLGQCLDQIADADRAFDAYSRVVTRNDKSVAGRYGMAMARRSQGRLKDALVQYRQLMSLDGAPLAGWVDVARLVLILNLSNPDRPEVEQALQQAERLEPLPPAVVVLRAEFWAAQRDLKKAREILLAKYGDAKTRPVEAWVALSALAEREGRPADALALLDEARKSCGDGVDLRLACARYWLRRGQAEARTGLAPLADGVDKFSTEDRRRLLRGLASICGQAGLTGEARTLWERMAAESSDLQSRIALFDLAARAGDDKDADKWLADLQKIEGSAGVLWRYARASALVSRAARGEKDGLTEARNLLTDVRGRRPRWSSAALCEAQLNDIEGKYEIALGLYQRAIELGEHDPATVGRTVVLLHQRRRDAEAADLLATKLPKEAILSPDTQRAAAEVALRGQNRTDALARAERAVAADSKDYHDHIWLGTMLWAAKQFDRAERELLKARDLAPTAPEVWTTLIQFLVATGHMDRAVVEVAAADRQLTAPSALPDLARCHEVVKQTDRARDLFQSAMQAAGDNPAVLRAAAAFYLRNPGTGSADLVLDRLVQSPDGLTRAWARRTKAMVMAAKGSAAAAQEALALLNEGSGGTPVSPDSADSAQDQRTRAQLLTLQNNGASRREAAQIFDGLIERQFAIPQDYLLAGQMYEAVGDWPKARQRYDSLLSLIDDVDPAAVVVAARSLFRHGDVDAGQKAMNWLDHRIPQSVATKEVRARLLHLQGKTREATALIRECATASGAGPQFAAAILEEFGEFAAAEEFYRAFAAKAERPTDALVLVYFLTRRGRPADALELCDRSWSSCPPLDVAQACLYALAKTPPTADQLGRVSARVDAAIAANPDQINLVAAQAAVRNFQGRFDEAVALYRRVLQKEPNHGTALNNLAWLLALQGAGQEALEKVNQATKAVGPAAGLLDTRAVANLALGRRDAAETAVKDLERLVAETPSPTTLFHLARAYDQIGRRSDARRVWQAAANQGLGPDGVHPLERPEYDRLARELMRPPAEPANPARVQAPVGAPGGR